MQSNRSPTLSPPNNEYTSGYPSTEQKQSESPPALQSSSSSTMDTNSERVVIKYETFKPHKPKNPGLRANVFVSKDCTRDLAEHIVEENWGADNGMLYKYLDYIFRCQVFDDQVHSLYTHTAPQQTGPFLQLTTYR